MILNSGTGSWMRELTKDRTKCMVKLGDDETVLCRQQKTLKNEKTNLHMRLL